MKVDNSQSSNIWSSNRKGLQGEALENWKECTTSQKCVTMKRITIILSWKIYILLNSKEITKVTGFKGKISNLVQKVATPTVWLCTWILVDMLKWLTLALEMKKNTQFSYFVSVYWEAIVEAFYFQLILYHSLMVMMISEFHTYPWNSLWYLNKRINMQPKKEWRHPWQDIPLPHSLIDIV